MFLKNLLNKEKAAHTSEGAQAPAAGHAHRGAGAHASAGRSSGGPSVTTVDLAGLTVYVHGLKELTPPSQAGVPDVCVAVHMHGRTGSARHERTLANELWTNTQHERQVLGQGQRTRDFLLVTFDSRDHGERITNPEAQKSWKEGNSTHA